MEQMIAKLLSDFEHGKMSRRQLIQSLAVTAAAAGAGQAAAAGTGFNAFTVNHISYQVSDYRRTRDFYADLLGMTPAEDDGKQCRLHFGNTGAHLLARNARAGAKTPLVDHIAYAIENWNMDAVGAELKRRGLNPRPDNLSFHVKDPDGYDLQICSPETGKM